MWYYEDRPSLEDKKIEAFFLKTTQNADLAHGLSRFWNLYHYLVATNPTSSKMIRESVLMNQIDKRPFFSEDASDRVFQLMPITKDPQKYNSFLKERILKARKRKLVGGGANGKPLSDTETLDNLVDWLIQSVTSRFVNMGFDSTKSTILGKVAYVWSYVLWLLTLPIRIIPMIENNPYIGGPILRLVIDLLLSILPRIILAQDMIVSAIAPPLMVIGVGFGVEFISMLIGLIFGMITFILSLATGRKGAAFVNFIQIFPVFGPMLRRIILDGVDVYDLVQRHRKSLGKLPIVGSYIYTQPSNIEQPVAKDVGSRRTTRRRNFSPKKMGRTGRRSAKYW